MPSGGQFGCLAELLVLQLGHLYSNSKKSITCFVCRLGISSIMWWVTCIGWCSGVLQWSHVCFFGGSRIKSGVLGLGLVWPMCPLGLPGKRLVLFLFLWSPVLVGYIRIEGGVCGFSWRIRARLRLSFSFLRVRFSWVSCCIFWQFWQFWFVSGVKCLSVFWCYSWSIMT
jgi:hypothetical protein